MSKKILVICQYYYPENFKITEICEELVKKGNDITVLTGLPNYNMKDIPEKYKNKKNRIETINGVKIRRVNEIARKKGMFRLGLNYISFCFFGSLEILRLENNFDKILIYQLSPVLMAIPGIIYKKIYKKAIVLYCLDLWPESLKNIIKNDKNLVYRVMKLISNYIYKNVDRLAITSKSFYKYFKNEHGIKSEKIYYIPQAGEDRYLLEDLSSIDNGIIDFMFMGNIGIMQDIECILKAIEVIESSKKYKIHFVGDGSFLEKAKEIVQKKNLQNKVIFHGRHSFEKMIDFYKIADICLVTLKGGTYISHTLPLKLQGYMAAGKPIIGAIDGDAYEIINESKCGLCTNSGNWKELGSLMSEVIKNQGKLIKYGKNGKKYYEENFRLNNQIENILELLK